MGSENKILNYAQELGEAANHAEKVATIEEGDVYSLSLLDTDGLPMPVGLPRLVIVNGEQYRFVTGEEALHLLASFDFEE